jgi:hypothetical protein
VASSSRRQPSRAPTGSPSSRPPERGHRCTRTLSRTGFASSPSHPRELFLGFSDEFRQGNPHPASLLSDVLPLGPNRQNKRAKYLSDNKTSVEESTDLEVLPPLTVCPFEFGSRRYLPPSSFLLPPPSPMHFMPPHGVSRLFGNLACAPARLHPDASLPRIMDMQLTIGRNHHHLADPQGGRDDVHRREPGRRTHRICPH